MDKRCLLYTSVKTIELEQNEIRSLLPEASEPIDQAAQEDEAIPQDELDDKIAGEAGVHEYVVSTGDTLSSILNQYGIDMGDITPVSYTHLDVYKRQVFEYAARQVKQTVVGIGSAEKSQVQHMVRTLLKLPANPQADAADALAIAITHCHVSPVSYTHLDVYKRQ